MFKKYNAWKEKLPKVLAEIVDWAEVIVIAGAIAFLVDTFLIANSSVPTGSMETTINAGDRVIGSRLTYNFRDPERGDVVIFKYGWRCRSCKKAYGQNPAPDECPYCGSELHNPATVYYVKRIIGLPGDRIEIKAGGTCKQTDIVSEAYDSVKLESDPDRELMTAEVYVNGEKLEEDYLREPMLYTGDMEFEVPEGEYFMMGDNRNNSLDARYWTDSYISEDDIIANVLFRYWPITGFKVIK